MKTTTQKQTASQAYTARLAEVQKQIERIQKALTTHADSKLNWSHVGDLGYVTEQLQNAADFITGEGE
jgi:putative IMPACT (imprinted ancient) family translation regulator